jgi:hypothetical protein
MECRSVPSNAGSFAANAGLRGRQLQLFLAEKAAECRSALFEMQVATFSDLKKFETFNRFCSQGGLGVWKETASGSKADRQQRQQVLKLAQAREINLILATELTRWGALNTGLVSYA